MPTALQIANTKRQRELKLATCRRCKTEQPWAAFPASPSRRPFGLASMCRPCDNERKAGQKRSKWYAMPELMREQARAKNLKRLFGITTNDYDRMFTKQKGLCALCGQPETYIHPATQKPARLAVDHCHAKGHVRQLLCSNCNRGLGFFKDNPKLLEKAIQYLERNNGAISSV